MLQSRLSHVLAGTILAMSSISVMAQPGQSTPGMQCAACQVTTVTAQDLVDVVSDVLGVNQSSVTAVAGDKPDRFRVTLHDGSQFSVAADGPVFRHQNMVQRRLLQTEEGGLHLRSQTRLELQLRSAVHRETAVISEMLRLGWNNFFWKHNGMEVESQNTVRYCFQADMQVRAQLQTPPSGISITQDADGNLIVIHGDGIRQRLHACAHDFAQLRDHVRELLQQQIVMEMDGTILVNIDAEQRRFRLAATLHYSDITGQTAFVTKGDRLYLRYRDGWEQEIIEIL